MLDFIQVIVASITSLFLLVSSPFVNSINPSLTPTPTPTVVQQNTIKATGNYSYQGYTVNVTVEFAKSGGTVKGNLSGDCAGTLNSSYIVEGENGGSLTGKAEGTCQIVFFNLNATANLTGKILLNEKAIVMNFEGKAGDIIHNGTLNLKIE